MTSPPLSQLLDVHRDLESLLAAHQAALLDRDLKSARDRLDRFRAALVSHIEDEERWILPAYEELPHTTESYSKLYRGEHRKLLAIATEIGERLDALTDDPSAAEVISLLDRECFFKDLMSHHDVREQNDLYPVLDKALPPAARDEIWSRLHGDDAASPPPSR